MNRRMHVNEVARHQAGDKFFYLDPISGMESQHFDKPTDREAEINLHYIERGKCPHEWEELTRKRSHSEVGIVSGLQECKVCGLRAYYTKEEE